MEEKLETEFGFNLVHESPNFPSGRAMLFGEYLLEEGDSTRCVYSRADFIFWRDSIVFSHQGKKLAELPTSYCHKFDVIEDNIVPFETNLVAAQALLINPHINSEVYDIFKSRPGEYPLTIVKEDGNITGFYLGDTGNMFISFYKMFLQNKDGLKTDGDFTKLREQLKSLEKKTLDTEDPIAWEGYRKDVGDTRKKVIEKLLGEED